MPVTIARMTLRRERFNCSLTMEWLPQLSSADQKDSIRRNDAPFQTQIRDLAARYARGFPVKRSPSKNQRAQGMPDARCTRDLVCNVHKEVCTRAYRAAESIRHSLRNGFTAYIVLSPADRAFCHRRPREALASQKLDASIRGIRTTRLYRTLLSRSSVATSASTASHPALVTIAKRPSYRDGTTSIYR